MKNEKVKITNIYYLNNIYYYENENSKFDWKNNLLNKYNKLFFVSIPFSENNFYYKFYINDK